MKKCVFFSPDLFCEEGPDNQRVLWYGVLHCGSWLLIWGILVSKHVIPVYLGSAGLTGRNSLSICSFLMCVAFMIYLKFKCHKLRLRIFTILFRSSSVISEWIHFETKGQIGCWQWALPQNCPGFESLKTPPFNYLSTQWQLRLLGTG